MLAAPSQLSPSWLRWHPTLPVLYSTQETNEGSASALVSYRLTGSGELVETGRVSTCGGSACHFTVHPSCLAIACANHGNKRGNEGSPEQDYVGDITLLHDMDFDGAKFDNCGGQRNLSKYAELMKASGKNYSIENVRSIAIDLTSTCSSGAHARSAACSAIGGNARTTTPAAAPRSSGVPSTSSGHQAT